MGHPLASDCLTCYMFKCFDSLDYWAIYCGLIHRAKKVRPTGMLLVINSASFLKAMCPFDMRMLSSQSRYCIIIGS